jgi:hypothetical protein
VMVKIALSHDRHLGCKAFSLISIVREWPLLSVGNCFLNKLQGSKD